MARRGFCMCECCCHKFECTKEEEQLIVAQLFIDNLESLMMRLMMMAMMIKYETDDDPYAVL